LKHVEAIYTDSIGVCGMDWSASGRLSKKNRNKISENRLIGQQFATQKEICSIDLVTNLKP
jgi:hypothetical protein